MMAHKGQHVRGWGARKRAAARLQQEQEASASALKKVTASSQTPTGMGARAALPLRMASIRGTVQALQQQGGAAWS